MKTVDIITRDMRQLHGANKVTEKLIFGREIFREHGFNLRYVISRDGCLDCSKYTTSTLGVDLNTSEYRRKRFIIDNLKKLPIYKTSYVQDRIIRKEINDNRLVLDYVNQLETPADIVIFQDPFVASYCLENGFNPAKSIFISHADKDPLEQLLLSRASLKGTATEAMLREKLRTLFTKVNQVITICESSKKYMKDIYGLDCPCIHNGIEDLKLKDYNKYSIGDGCLHFVIVASLQYRKGQDIAIEALSLLKKHEVEKIRLHLVGDGKDRDVLRDLTKKLRLENSVVFHGPVMDVHELLQYMDAFLLPSRADTVPIAIIEAMRAGLPVFASDVGEVASMIDGCGEIIEADPNDIAMLYKKIIDGKIDLLDYGRKSRIKYETEFNLTTMIESYSHILEKLLSIN